ncbi:hypothetical protein JJB09_03190 [Rhizobium sp. KVB221]|uniref:Calcium-binding protein n=1 Tax=Rhizobium setariae TaxID=2801340 RepID=A0A936YIZ9_9HYPH|nr:hypothetical protein [Rhizobium setariae]MBL0371023.1 hypothetical protein [Rhizobium setariae]
MARLESTDLLGGYRRLERIYDEKSIVLPDANQTARNAIFIDHRNDSEVVLFGAGLTYKEGQVTGGTVKVVSFNNSDGSPMLTLEAGKFDAAQLHDLLVSANGVEKLIRKLLSGDDEFTGSSLDDYISSGAGDDRVHAGAGDDIIDGGRGDDHLRGGAGSDIFIFQRNSGKDVIADFDASGGRDRQDYLDIDRGDIVDIRKSGDDVIIDLGGGDTLTLLDVARKDISKADFDMNL